MPGRSEHGGDKEGEGFSRRELLRGRFLRGLADIAGAAARSRLDALKLDRLAAAAMASTAVPAPASRFGTLPVPVLRPPGAIDEPTFLAECTRCEECLKACPHDAIVLAPPRLRSAAGTPVIDPLRSPCRMCPDTPCIDVCDPGVLTRLVPLKMGSAVISEALCLPHRGAPCTACSEQCPVPGAIELTNGKPRIVDTICTGCGVCHHVCPAPQNAVIVMPLRERPAEPKSPGA